MQSTDSFESDSSDDDSFTRHLESDHVTQVQRIAARQTIRRSVGGILQRTLSRSRSKPQLLEQADIDVVIGVVVEEAATVEHDVDPNSRPESRAMIYADVSDRDRQLRSQPSRYTIAASAEKRGIVSRARELGRRLRGRSQSVALAGPPSPS